MIMEHMVYDITVNKLISKLTRQANNLMSQLTSIVVTHTANPPQLLYSTLPFKTLLCGEEMPLGGDFIGGKIPW